MCLYPSLIINKKYTPTEKNGGVVPHLKDKRFKYVPIGCGECIECRKQKANEWIIRLQEEIEGKKYTFVTLTFSNDSLEEIKEAILEEYFDVDTGEQIKEIEDNEDIVSENNIATKAVRRFLERWRKKKGKSVRHWLITEKGHTGTERIHLHGLINSDDKEFIKNTWRYGFVYIGDYVNEKTIQYISKYVTKVDTKHRDFKGKILCSKGIGNNFFNKNKSKLNKFNEELTKEYITNKQGYKLGLPIYYRNNLYNEDEREMLWGYRLDKNKRWIDGTEVEANDYKRIDSLTKSARVRNKRMGYGGESLHNRINDSITYEMRREEINEKEEEEEELSSLITPPPT